MADRRFVVFAPGWTPPDAAVQICRQYDGRLFAMSPGEARDLATELAKAADQWEARRRPESSGSRSES